MAKPRKIREAEAGQHARNVVFEAQVAGGNVTSGLVGIFPTPKPETAVRPPEPKPKEQPTAKFRGAGQYIRRISGRLETITFRGGEYTAKSQPVIDWCREYGFEEV